MKVLVSYGFGAGWSTWNTEWDDCATDPTLIELIEDGKVEDALAYAEDKWEGCYANGLFDCVVETVSEGELFQIREYDGSESLVIFDPTNWRRV